MSSLTRGIDGPDLVSILIMISSIWSRCFSFFFRRTTYPNGRIHLPDIEDGQLQGTSIVPTVQRRALLVGISYTHSWSEVWWPLENPHKDVDMFRDLLVGKQSSSAKARMTRRSRC